MDPHDKRQLQTWAEAWKAAGPELEKIRQQEIRNADTRLAITSLDAAFKSAMLHFSPAPYSGLVDQQRLFQRLRK
jgi:hypothetical protein